MPRLSIEISPQQHKLIKANAALQGQSLKDFVLERALSEGHQNEAEALQQLSAALKPALKNARAGKFSERSVQDIIRDARSA